MKDINYKLLLCCSTLLLLPQLVQAQSVESCKPIDCAALGYTRSNTDYCATYARCPFDASYKICTHVCDDSYIEVAKKVIPMVIEHSSNSLTEAEIMANMDASLTKDLGYDSLDLVELTMAVETEFSVTILDSDAAKIKTVNEIISYLGETCDAYPLTSCPSGATCDSQYDITSCKSGYKLMTTILGGSTCKKQTTGTVCSGGYYNNNGTCTICPAGSYSLAGATSCTKCAVGTYQDKTGQTSCKTCATATVVGETVCASSGDTCPTLTSCPDGATCSVSNKKYTITKCDVGFTETLGGATTGSGSAIKKCIISCEPNCGTASSVINVYGCSKIKQYSARCYICCDSNSETTINNGSTYHGTYGLTTCTETGAATPSL